MDHITDGSDTTVEGEHVKGIESWAKKEMNTLLKNNHCLSDYQRYLEDILVKAGVHSNRFGVVSLLMLKNLDTIKKRLTLISQVIEYEQSKVDHPDSIA